MPRELECENAEEADWTVKNFNGLQLRGHKLSLCRGPKATVFVAGLPPDCSLQELRSIFLAKRSSSLLPLPKKKPELRLRSEPPPPEVGCRVEMPDGLAGLVTAWKDETRSWLVEPESANLRSRLGPRTKLAARLTESGEPVVELADSSVCLASGQTGMVTAWQPRTSSWRVDWDPQPDEEYQPDEDEAGRPECPKCPSEDESYVAEKLRWKRLLAAELGAEKEHWEKLLAAEQDAAAEQMESLEQEHGQKLAALQGELDKLRFKHRAQDQVISKLKRDLEKFKAGEAPLEGEEGEGEAGELERLRAELEEERQKREAAEQERTDADLAASAQLEAKQQLEAKERQLQEELSSVRFQLRRKQLKSIKRSAAPRPKRPRIDAETLHRLFCEGAMDRSVSEAGAALRLRLVPQG